MVECEPGFFGLNCAERCRCSGNAVCDPISGRCAVCESGFGGDSCQDECESGTFGSGCSKFCHCRSGEVCDRVMGECSSGCAHHWYGTDCQTSGCFCLLVRLFFYSLLSHYSAT
ncbi:hypothetical protein CAPTEDRAFT_112001 [Capitella teleta]|uniref:Laminin EGF-like domain-containing protein n=1 Tax=Capitella teleta TaxID=283909 RepID=R7T580_CAPTE|nr:hypothetical protein CAPTEDRAFT_112001 [Capitella teleta]|eukprot:ELT88459.1 hypothetical protein CAPTEDRAFT_112001 [Capitella teleta]